MSQTKWLVRAAGGDDDDRDGGNDGNDRGDVDDGDDGDQTAHRFQARAAAFPPPEECDSLLRPAGRAGATFWWPRLTPG